MSQHIRYTLFFLLAFFSFQVHAQNTKVLINDVPLTLQGKWQKNGMYEEGGQYALTQKETGLLLLISARDPKQMEFYTEGLEGFELALAFYKWDADYWATEGDEEVQTLKENRENKYVVWKLKMKEEENIILYGVKADKIVGITIAGYSDKIKMNEKEAVGYLENIFLN